jgi:hypothetical protein
MFLCLSKYKMISWMHIVIKLYALFCFFCFFLFSWWGSKWDWYMISLEEENISELRIWGKIIQPRLDSNQKNSWTSSFSKNLFKAPMCFICSKHFWSRPSLAQRKTINGIFKIIWNAQSTLSCCWKIHNNIIYHKLSYMYPTHAVVF